MKDPRIEKLAEVLVEHSTDLQPGDRVLIDCFDLPDTQLAQALVRKAVQRGAVPLVSLKSNALLRVLYRQGSKEMFELAGEFERARMEKMQAYIGIRGSANASELSDVSSEQMDLYNTHIWQPVHIALRVPETKWVVLRYPTASMAQMANTSTEAFEDFFFRVCTVDYQAMAKAQKPLQELMEATDKVQIKGPGTDLEFSIRGMAVVPCNGERNIPDGEVFTAPLRESVQGVISYNTPTLYQGNTFENVRFEFKDGKIVRATCGGDQTRLNAILDSDEGARHIGEWSIGCNPHILHPMKDTLFDEKIAGSTHLTPGNAYDEADNGNRSKIHWDIVLIQREEYGGGEIYFDGKLIRKDGKFTLDQLQPLDS